MNAKKTTGWLDGGRIETALACVVLMAVIGLFVRFYRPHNEAPPAPGAEIHVPATATTPSH
jgi:hypothetical protein